MSRQTPYLQRRGNSLSFRIAVPPDLRHIVGGREITKSLSTANMSQAIPMALNYAACAKRMFGELRAAMSAPDNNDEQRQPPDLDKLRKVGQQAKQRIQLDDLKEQHYGELLEQRCEHLRELEQTKLTAENETLRHVLAGFKTLSIPTHSPAQENTPAPIAIAHAPTFKVVIDGFLDKYKKRNKPAMLKKHQPVLMMLLDVVGDKPIHNLLQADINAFFDLLDKLPPRWSDACRKEGLTVRQLAELEHDVTLGPKSFYDTYIASVRPFLIAAKKDWQDQGFPLGLTTDGIEYLGDREEGEDKQRAFKQAELKRLFEGAEMRGFASDQAQAHRYWLPHIGLFTGARVNEICQLNPQMDILQDTETGTWYLWITKETEGDTRIRKSVKTDDARKVPIHKKLIELGFLKYVELVKSTGAKLLFPEWKPINRRASGEAEKWFRQFLRDANLRDETPKHNILGMHAFRHTLLTYGAIQKPPLSLFCITGHTQDELPIHASGAGKAYLTLSLLSPLHDRAALLDQLDYGLNFFVPKST